MRVAQLNNLPQVLAPSCSKASQHLFQKMLGAIALWIAEEQCLETRKVDKLLRS
jgi:hypothetical protein